MKTFSLSDKITFGKYSNKELPVAMTIEEIIDQNPEYLAWCLDKIDGFELDDKAFRIFDDAMIEASNNDYPESVLWDY